MHPDLERAIAHREAGELEQARQAFAVLLNRYPDDPQVNYHFAWLLDKLGEEMQAIPYYEGAIQLGLEEDDLRGALLGLGSTYRSIGQYQEAIATFKRGVETFPDAKEFSPFLAMALYNADQCKEAVRLLLHLLLDATDAEDITRYKSAILTYAEDLDRVWS